MRTHVFVVALVLTAAAASAEGPNATFKAAHTADGKPDLQGVWNFSSGVPLQRPASFAGKKFFTKEEFDKQRAAFVNGLSAIGRFAPVENVGFDWIDSKVYIDDLRTSLISYPENGRLPSLVEGVRRMPDVQEFVALLNDAKGGAPPPGLVSLLAMFGGGRRDSHNDFGMSERCLLGPAVPFVPGIGDNYVQILQSGDHVVLLTDEFRRMIPLDRKAQVGERLRSWSGASKGHWEGDTLVVETRNFSNRAPGFAGAGNSRDKVVTERFTRTSKSRIEYTATVVDPSTFQDKVELSFAMASVDARLYESACHEGNYSLPNALSAVRAEERETAQTGSAK
jgi:hypothetical protein